MADFLRHIRELDQNCDPPQARVFRLYCRSRDGLGPIELNGAHFHPEIVSLPLRLIPMNIAPIGTGRSECCSASHPK